MNARHQHIIVLCLIIYHVSGQLFNFPPLSSSLPSIAAPGTSLPVARAHRNFIVLNNCTFGLTAYNSKMGQKWLNSGESMAYQVPKEWSGRIWAQRKEDPDIPLYTLAEWTLDAYMGMDFYDVSLVDGFNVPMSIIPTKGKGACLSPSCSEDVTEDCPSDLAYHDDHGRVIACQSACSKFSTDGFCCRNEWNDPLKCKASVYADFFKRKCPTAYSYAYNDNTSTFTCTAADYKIVFCPSN
ncbi:pathogenesis-related thaumatin-like protein [Planoprotostelium fungivorum]|uniref:Pathogenesis-related thaumatin-like protein n=1 Tax=Planoprotostelium fungivorum TaxID=1890364 RepID=A0A2P6NGK3_9EUKA|nr:pathogenesis-related thaumatin-like protein [Planoprotostelium fungivorum]